MNVPNTFSAAEDRYLNLTASSGLGDPSQTEEHPQMEMTELTLNTFENGVNPISDSSVHTQKTSNAGVDPPDQDAIPAHSNPARTVQAKVKVTDDVDSHLPVKDDGVTAVKQPGDHHRFSQPSRPPKEMDKFFGIPKYHSSAPPLYSGKSHCFQVS
ncbi:hypothetical protein GYMLUDRAFT_63177 [Collybiopsis luxurians FD-317 M1]|uniref:Uncharacterized protein n=1 Tax=Collybiopsis luxurians FD-317 M1 TaxID=944289 RepID=A0A0D0C8U2_9AGAR|nr:hypothetical protein GYMLUDRAFT_63177 [Collybiopsis luxurians FD-317 M1]